MQVAQEQKQKQKQELLPLELELELKMELELEQELASSWLLGAVSLPAHAALVVVALLVLAPDDAAFLQVLLPSQAYLAAREQQR